MPDPVLVELAPGIHCLPGVVNVGVLELPAQPGEQRGCLLIDSGSDKDHAKRILKACRARGLEPRAIINTHSHADHYGGNAHLQEQLGIPAYAPIFEEAIIRYPVLEPIYLWNGARPPKALQNKFLMGQASGSKVLNEPGPKTILGLELELIDVAGHAHQMFAVRCNEVLFASDAVFGPQTLEKHPLPFTVDLALQREAVEAIRLYARDFGVLLLVPGHGDPSWEIDALCDANLRALARVEDAVRSSCASPSTLPEVLERVCAMLGVQMGTLGQYVLNQTAVLAYLTDLEERGVLQMTLANNRLCWVNAALV